MDENFAIVRGFVDHITYHNEENGYTVFLFFPDAGELSDDYTDGITCTGAFVELLPGESLELKGHLVLDPTYGMQFRCDSYEFIKPSTAMEIERYLSGGAVKGIGKTLAKRIVKKFGDDTFRIMESEPERLSEISGISMRMAQQFSIEMMEHRGIRDACVYLQKFGISMRLALRIYDRYEKEIYDIVENNPYRLCDEIEGIGFKTADLIASRSGLPPDSEERIAACISYLLNSAAGDGHTYLPLSILKRNLLHLIKVPEEVFENVLTGLSVKRTVVQKKVGDEERVYLERFFRTEKRLSSRLMELLENNDSDFREKIPECLEVEKDEGIVLDEKQREAVCRACTSGLFILTGGPGTGKTTALRVMIRLFERQNDTVALCAPTGRAAKRMSEATGRPAKTIHRLLEVKSMAKDDDGGARDIRGGIFERDSDNPLSADVVICDETSMIDIFLFDALTKALPYGCSLILVGDENQLPSVGPGNVLKDLLKSGLFPSCHLDTIFRQAEKSDIVKNAHLINEGKQVLLNNKSEDFFFLEMPSASPLLSKIAEFIKKKLPPYVGCKDNEIQVMCPSKKGSAGVLAVNSFLQERLNPPDQTKREYKYGSKLFRTGDKVMQTKNNYRLPWTIKNEKGVVIDSGEGIYNGDTGIIKAIYPEIKELKVIFDDGKEADYPFSGLEDIDLAYAITIHKSQGSEYPAVIIILLPGPQQLLNRNILYTAVTRAKKCVVLMGKKEVFYEMEENDTAQVRYSGLSDILKEECLKLPCGKTQQLLLKS
ncbi:MAG: ATP-dependent RecD-like DNA helicase [Lachnospiraceae bacterium]|nr:ATP-dependent RecD-like DNA helicase [Lachnospiraceae bacterium]